SIAAAAAASTRALRRRLAARAGCFGALGLGHTCRSGVGRLLLVGLLLGGLLLGLAHRLAAERAAHGRALHEHPADVGHGLAADETALVEEPAVLAVELLEGVVRQHDGVGPIRDLEEE